MLVILLLYLTVVRCEHNNCDLFKFCVQCLQNKCFMSIFVGLE